MKAEALHNSLKISHIFKNCVAVIVIIIIIIIRIIIKNREDSYFKIKDSYICIFVYFFKQIFLKH